MVIILTIKLLIKVQKFLFENIPDTFKSRTKDIGFDKDIPK